MHSLLEVVDALLLAVFDVVLFLLEKLGNS
jgi:hypothetical protein